MIRFWKTVEYGHSGALGSLAAESRDVIVVTTYFNPRDKLAPSPPQNCQLSGNSIRILAECARILKFGGLFFVYGLPRDLAFWGQHLSLMGNDSWQMIFKYWIALDIDDAPRINFLKPAHQGLLLFMKSRAAKQPRFQLNTSTVRMPHARCAACGLNLKDWGGKKHLMNPKGATLSDVWRDLPRRNIRDTLIPKEVLTRIGDLTRVDGGSYLHVIQRCPHSTRGDFTFDACGSRREEAFTPKSEIPNPQSEIEAGLLTSAPTVDIPVLERDKVYLSDCVSFLKQVAELHPDGVFDLAFADPPYNLQKLYSNYEDALAEQHYIEWCNGWLDGMVRTLRPGGSLLVLNLPKWAIYHAAFLNQRLEFRHWIAWDALSDPRGKLMPAHYALLYYTKPGAKSVFNYVALNERAENGSESRLQAAGGQNVRGRLKAGHQTRAAPDYDFVLPPDAPKYCLRAACVKSRKQRGDDERVELSDVWFDIHRIKHKRDRDAHPCQLPERLMERIIRLTTNRGGWVFDPFCGAGTTAIAATKLGRHFVVVDCDPNYVRITNEKLAAMKQNADRFGNFTVARKSVVRPKAANSKKVVETYLQNLARRLERVPTELDIVADQPDMLRRIDSIYPYRSAALKRCKVVLAEAPASFDISQSRVCRRAPSH